MLFLLFLIIGCATKSISLKPSFWEQKDLKIGVAVVDFPKVGLHKKGGQGLLDMALVDAATGEFQAYLEQIDISTFEDLIGIFTTKCEEKGMSALKIDSFINLEEYEKFSAPSSGEYSKKDLRSLSDEYDINMLILLSIEAVGTIRSYYGFIATGRPKGYCIGKGQLIDLDNNEILWLYSMNEEEGSHNIEGEWKQPPDYPNLTEAIIDAVEYAKSTLESDFF
jgi:hypothetical protein